MEEEWVLADQEYALLVSFIDEMCGKEEKKEKEKREENKPEALSLGTLEYLKKYKIQY